jgi:hypothetical protein
MKPIMTGYCFHPLVGTESFDDPLIAGHYARGFIGIFIVGMLANIDSNMSMLSSLIWLLVIACFGVSMKWDMGFAHIILNQCICLPIKKLADLCIVAIIKTIAFANAEASHFRENTMSNLWNNILCRTTPILTKLVAHLHSVKLPCVVGEKVTGPECGSQLSTNLHLPVL